eukprot:XP_011667157.1 PREDICTED: uncharacterized protein LOC105439647 [Strongylocentrotus purpuratus]
MILKMALKMTLQVMTSRLMLVRHRCCSSLELMLVQLLSRDHLPSHLPWLHPPKRQRQLNPGPPPPPHPAMPCPPHHQLHLPPHLPHPGMACPLQLESLQQKLVFQLNCFDDIGGYWNQYCSMTHMDKYETAGAMMAYSIVHRGPLPTFFTKMSYKVISGQEACPRLSDVTDNEVREVM